MQKILSLSLFVVLLLGAGLAAFGQEINKNIVKIYTTADEHSYTTPWQMEGYSNYEGSGCIIRDNLILTNAHVVSDQTFITVKRSGQTKKYIAEVKFVAHECDLAVLEVNDRSFYPDTSPLELGELPFVGDSVSVYGYPSGTEHLTITRGVVSRVSHETYVHSSISLLCSEIDAAINSGNSGGPVITGNRIVGVAMMTSWGENEGYMVSVPVIRHFLQDIDDGYYDGVPDLGIKVQYMENPSIRRYYGLEETKSGVLVCRVYLDSPARDILLPGDVIISIDGNDVANDGTITFRGEERTSYMYVVQNKQINDRVILRVLRGGELRDLSVPLTIPSGSYRLVPFEQFDREPVYYIYGGFVFSPLSENLIMEFGEDSWYGDWQCEVPTNLMYSALYMDRTDDRKEVVVIIGVLSDEVNMGYEDMLWEIVSRVNGKEIGSMAGLLEAIESNREPYHLLEMENGDQIVLNRKKAARATRRILRQYRVKHDRSIGLRRKR